MNGRNGLDSITYKHYLENVLQLQPGIAKLFDNFLATSGLASDKACALHAMKSCATRI